LSCAQTVSMADVLQHRAKVVSTIRDELGCSSLEFVNGGGSGSFAAACADPSLTEVTAGSGFVQSQLFDWFMANQSAPALFFALQVTRSCDPGIVCCQSGGFIASGAVSPDKCPIVVRPRQLVPFPDEGFGEVQTPLRWTGSGPCPVRVGDAVLLRPAKAGEIAERFNTYVLVDLCTATQSVVPTYRGMGMAFY
jgi:D-serine deaminase-like pyridoxal phosphate-dependent protein